MSQNNINNKPAVRLKLNALIEYMSEDMQLKLLKYLENKLNIRVSQKLKIEKREDSRRTCLISADYMIGNHTFRGYILDISAFGVFVETNEPFPTGREISLSFSLPNHHKPFSLKGKVVWSGSQGIGVKFDYLSPHHQEILKAFAEQSEEIFEIIS
jgi:Tfp pilus assembly protein PilZ